MEYPILAQIRQYVDLKFRGLWWGLCPFHAEKRPSFTVDARKGTWYCFGCQKGGDLVDLVKTLADREKAKCRHGV